MGGDGPQRPPWTSETLIRDGCDSCGKCIPACPEGILIPGPAGTPVLDFARGECTFCGVCAEACHAAGTVFTAPEETPWEAQGGRVARIGQGCILSAGISCQLCTDYCDNEALRMDLSHRPVGRITLDESACKACGACVQGCPEGAITIAAPALEKEAANA
jgi:ferredoxin-type protein NapF